MNVGTVHRCKYHNLFASTRNCHIETAFATDTIYRPERHRKPPLRIRSISDGEHNNITLITLNIFEILNKECIRLTVVKKLRRPFAIFRPLIYQILN